MLARAFSPYLPRRAHFTWGVAPGWYGSGLWPLLSLFSDQSANGALQERGNFSPPLIFLPPMFLPMIL